MRVLVAGILLASVVLPFRAQAAPAHSAHVAYVSPGFQLHVVRSVMAPADEYFGRQKESILEIRNRLDALERMTDDEVTGRGSELDDLRDAVLDWQHKYPRDPWLPRTMQRLHDQYRRAGGG